MWELVATARHPISSTLRTTDPNTNQIDPCLERTGTFQMPLPRSGIFCWQEILPSKSYFHGNSGFYLSFVGSGSENLLQKPNPSSQTSLCDSDQLSKSHSKRKLGFYCFLSRGSLLSPGIGTGIFPTNRLECICSHFLSILGIPMEPNCMVL